MEAPNYPLARSHPDPWPDRWTYPLLCVLLVVYLLVGGVYVMLTPPWQVPDEPAHVNYARFVARTGRLPVLQMGDYDAAYLEALKANRFPPTMSVTSVRYEAHQPPLYYLLAAVGLRLFAPGALVPEPPYEDMVRAMYVMRWFSLILSVATLGVVFLFMRNVFPRHPSWALAAVAAVGFLPQHVAMMAGANNDALAELGLVLWLWLLARRLLGYTSPGGVGLGLVLGAMLLTKTTVYLPAALSLVAWTLIRGLPLPERTPWKDVLRQVGGIVVVALLVALPFYARNVRVYGWPDVLGLQRHAEVVVGQMTTKMYIAQYGWQAYWERAITWTFRSFWGQFGWMGVLMDARVYRGLLYFTAICLGAMGYFLWRSFQDRHGRWLRGGTPHYRTLSPVQHNILAMLSASALGTLLSYVGYNLSFLQHQGRYLFTALLPLVALVLPGLWLFLAPRAALRWGVGCLTVAVGVGLAAVLDWGPFTRWDGLMIAGLAVWFLAASRWPRWRPVWLMLPWVALAPLSFWVMWRFILPALT